MIQQYDRLKGGEWFPLLHKKDIIVLGQGGIGSWLTLFLSRIGCVIHTFDDDVFEIHNMSGQLVRSSDIGTRKTEAVKNIVTLLSPDSEIYTNGKYVLNSPSGDIVMCGFDNMDARKLAFDKWEKYVDTEAENPSSCFFVDGRLNPEQLQIFCIQGNNQNQRNTYRSEHLFNDSDVEEADCTFKQTTHSAAIIAGQMVGFLTNWISESSIRKAPFFYEQLIPLNISKKENI